MHTTEELEWALKTRTPEQCRKLLPQKLQALTRRADAREAALSYLLFRDHEAASEVVKLSKRRDEAKNSVIFGVLACLAFLAFATLLVVVANRQREEVVLYWAGFFLVAAQCVIDVTPWRSSVRKGWYSAIYRYVTVALAGIVLLANLLISNQTPAPAPAHIPDANVAELECPLIPRTVAEVWARTPG